MKVLNLKKIGLACFLMLFALATVVAGGQAEYYWDYVGDPAYKSPNHVEIDEASFSHQSKNTPNWQNDSAFYHIWVRSFKDSDGDGLGDLNGITQELDYIQKTLGFDAIWLSPIFECNGKSKKMNENMHGYDVIDFYAVNSYFGTEDDLTRLLDEAHKRGMKVIFDFVPNHTSNLNQWFIDSANSENGKRNWYLWAKKPLNWNPMGSSNTWHKYENSKQFYYGGFWGGMPDLNYRNYEVREEMKNVVRYWLNKGFDGIRADAVIYLIEEKMKYKNTAETHAWYQELRRDVFDKYAELGYHKFMVAESWITGDRTAFNQYLGTKENPEFHMIFDFEAGNPITSSVQNGKDVLTYAMKKAPQDSAGSNYGVFLGNHDEYCDRLGSVFLNDAKRQKLASAILMLRPNVPFVYYGNEIGQENATISGDIRLRYPYNWDLARSQEKDSTSLLQLTKVMTGLRQKYSCIRNGEVAILQAEKAPNSTIADTVSYVLSDGKEIILCVFNLSSYSKEKAVFTGENVPANGINVALLVGDSASPAVEIQDGKLTVSNMAPLSYRVYTLSAKEKAPKVLFDDETYKPGEKYTPPAPKVARMFIRGNFNSWAGHSDLMTDQKDGKVWTVDFELTPQTIMFKFDSTGNWTKGLFWGKGDGDNAVSNTSDYNLSEEIKEAGTYRFTLDLEKSTYSVEKL